MLWVHKPICLRKRLCLTELSKARDEIIHLPATSSNPFHSNISYKRLWMQSFSHIQRVMTFLNIPGQLQPSPGCSYLHHHFHLLLLVQSFILNLTFDTSANLFFHRPFPLLPDWFLDHFMFLFCLTAGFVCMVC